MTEPSTSRTRLPSLGPHGEGWVALQSVLLVVLFVSAKLGPAVDGTGRVVLATAGWILLVGGVALAVGGFLRQGRQFTTLPKPKDGAHLIDDGAYRLVRHPMYGGIVIGSAGWGLLWASPTTLGFAVLALLFFTLKSRREEAWLEERFPDYPAYRARTRRLIPWIF